MRIAPRVIRAILRYLFGAVLSNPFDIAFSWSNEVNCGGIWYRFASGVDL
jgi:hypothetical protein